MMAPPSKLERLFPLFGILRRYQPGIARRDFIAGLTVALFTIPQAMAYALIAGFTPSAGIITAVVASILGAAFGSSEFLVNGPTNAIAVMLAANAAIFASKGDPIQMIILLTLMIGVAQVGVAMFRLGSFTRFVSEPVLTGFTAGAGIYIAVNQLPSVLGLEKSTMVHDLWGWVPPSTALFDLVRAILSLGQANYIAVATGLATFGLVRGLQWIEPRLKRRLPAPFLTVLIVSVVCYLLDLGEASQGALKLKLVRDIEPVTRHLPSLMIPTLHMDHISALLMPTFAIGVLGAVEAIAIGKLLATKVGHPFDANRQLVGEGLCNIGAAFVGGFASSGSFTRTAVNFDSGAVTRMSVIFSGFLVLGIVMLFAPAADYIPIAVLAGTLMHIGLKLVNLVRMRLLIQTTISDRTVLMVTFFAVLLVRHLEQALFLGIFVALAMALRRAEGFKLARLREDGEGNLIEEPLIDAQCGEVVVIDLQGEMFFAAAEELEQRLRNIFRGGSRFMVLRLQHAFNIDATCVEALDHVAQVARAHGGRLILAGVRPGMYGTFERAGLVHHIGPECIFRTEPTLLCSTFKAIAHAHALADKEVRPGRPGQSNG